VSRAALSSCFAFFPPTGARWRLLPALLALVLLAGCSVVRTPTQARGHKVEDDLVKELVPGTSTRADVTALLGSPTAHAAFDDNVWIYVSSVTRSRIGRRPSVETQDVAVFTFRPDGVLQDIKRLSEDDSVPVDVVSRVTPSPGQDTTLLQEFFSNVTRLRPGAPASMGRR